MKNNILNFGKRLGNPKIAAVYFFLLFLIIFCSCTRSQSLKHIKYANEIMLVQKAEARDSLLLNYTSECWMAVRFDSYKKGITNPDSSEFGLKSIKAFYSPDKMKIIAWLIYKVPNSFGCNQEQGFFYSGKVMTGYRESINQLWKLYPVDLSLVTCANTEKQIIEILGQYYFKEMKTHSQYVNKEFLDPNYGGPVQYDLDKKMKKMGYNDGTYPVILKNFGYNLQDTGFWERSLLWQKGARIPGLYNFQTKGNVTPKTKNPELITPSIKYPDYILDMYN